MPDEKRMIDNFEVKTAIHISGKEIVFAENIQAEQPYMICECSWGNPFGLDIYSEIMRSDNYIEAMTEFSDRLAREVAVLAAERDALREQGVSDRPLTDVDCIPGSRQMDYNNRLIVLKPESLAAYARTPDNQLLLVTGGNGARPDARGSAVFCYEVSTGKHCRWERHHVAGILDPEKIPPWAKAKLDALEAKLQQDKPSLAGQLAQSKQEASRQSPQKDSIQDIGPER